MCKLHTKALLVAHLLGALVFCILSSSGMVN